MRINSKSLITCYRKSCHLWGNGGKHEIYCYFSNATMVMRKCQIRTWPVLLGSKLSCSVDVLVFKVPLGIPEIPLFHVSPSFTCSCARCASATNSICSDLDNFKRRIITLSQLWCYYFLNFARCPNELFNFPFVCFDRVCVYPVRCLFSLVFCTMLWLLWSILLL